MKICQRFFFAHLEIFECSTTVSLFLDCPFVFRSSWHRQLNFLSPSTAVGTNALLSKMHSKLVAQTRYDIARENRLHLTAVARDRDLEDFLQSFQLLSDSGRHGPSEMENTAMENRPTEKHPHATKTPIKIAMRLDPWSGDFEIIQAGFIQCQCDNEAGRGYPCYQRELIHGNHVF